MRTIFNKVVELFANVKQQFIEDLKWCPQALYLECLGTLFLLSSSLIVALLNKAANFDLVFSLYLVSSICLIFAAMLRSNSFLIILNFGCILLNLSYFLNR